MDAAAEIGKNAVVSKHQIQPGMSRLSWEGNTELVSRDQILRREPGQQGNIHLFPCSTDPEQD